MLPRSAREISTEIEDRLGFFPPFFEPALATPAVLENLWQQTLSADIDNPIPTLFKEKLAASLARYCAVPYWLLCHACALRPLGMSSAEVLALLQQPPLGDIEIVEEMHILKSGPLKAWPAAGSDLEQGIFYCCIAIFLGHGKERCQAKLRELLPRDLYTYLNLYLSYNRTCLSWSEAHPELNYENDRRVLENYASLVLEAPELTAFFANYRRYAEAREKAESTKGVDQQARRDLEDFFMQAPLPLVILDGPRHFFKLANPPYEKLIGRKASGKHLDEVFTQDELKTYAPILDAVYQTGKPFIGKEMPLSLEDENGVMQEHWIHLGYHPAHAPDGSVKGILAIVQDITESRNVKKALEESESNFRAFADSTPTMVFTTKPDGGVDYINPRWYEYSGVTPTETLGSAYASLLHPHDVENTMIKWKYAVDHQVRFDGEHRFRRADGMYRWFKVSIEPKFENDALVRWYGTMSDIHDQTVFAEELARAKVRADLASETKSSFLANMSHEIRTPLGAIIGFTELLREDGIDREERRNFIEVINRNAKSLTRVIDDILDLSKVEAGRLDIEYSSVSLREILQDVVALFTDRAKSIGIALILEIPSTLPAKIRIDPVRIRQILINIIGNAVKFTEKGSVRVIVEVLESAGAEKGFRVLVKDTGRGLSEEQQSKLFQPFSQADNTTTREYGGTGLGLVLSRRLANALGGTVDILAAQPGRGCTFVISFQAQVANPAHPEPAALIRKTAVSGAHVLQGQRVLLVEDSPDNQMLIKRVLVRNGATVVLADNGSQGVNRALEGEFDVVLMDIQMPTMDGYTAMAKLCEAGYRRPVIALTAHAMEEERERTRSAGFAAHVTKPVEFPVLVEAIIDVVGANDVRMEK